ncbi:hypothetical protein Bbelb_272570 [Branchiostoma belcheri]|nr:hypothetical protein Bbelb_272570 [Branchiostoma belcheri]
MSGNDIEMHTRNPNPMYTRNNTNPYPMDAQNDVNPNPVYLQSTIEPNVSSGPTRDPNPMYTRNTFNPCPNDVNPNPMYLQTPMEPPNATTRTDENKDTPSAQASADAHQQDDGVNSCPDDNHCLQPYSVTRPQDVEASSIIMTEDNLDSPCVQPYTVPYMCQDDMVCSTASGDDHTRPPLQDQPTAAPNNINDAPISPNPMFVKKLLNALNPNPMYVPSTIRSDENEDIPCTQTLADADQQGDEASFSPVNNDDNHCLQPYAVTHREDGEANFSPANNDDNHCLQPYAVTHQKETAVTTRITSDDEDIQPTCQGDIPCNTASGDTPTELSSQNQPAAASNNTNDNLGIPSNNDILNALNPNPIYVPHVQHRSACAAVYAALILVSCIVSGVFLWFNFGTRPQPEESGDRSLMAESCDRSPMAERCNRSLMAERCNRSLMAERCNRSLMAERCNRSLMAERCNRSLMAERCNRSLMAERCNRSLMAESGDIALEKITFRGKGSLRLGVAVSADYEIFVTDYVRRVYVFSINGTYLRTFRTVLSGENGTVHIQPSGVAIGVQPGYLWIVGQPNPFNGYIHVVKYSRIGKPVKMIELHVVEPYFHAVIAVDVCNNKIIVGHRDTVMVFHPNGSVYRSFNVRERVMIGGITLDSEGNILIALAKTKTAMVYSHSGDKLFEFGSTFKEGDIGPLLREFSGICLDTLGRIIVANHKVGRIDMFTSRGKFVRTIEHIEGPWGITMGPGGELVACQWSAVTVFPRHMLLS